MSRPVALTCRKSDMYFIFVLKPFIMRSHSSEYSFTFSGRLVVNLK